MIERDMTGKTWALGDAFSVHGITGSLGWALAPALLVPITLERAGADVILVDQHALGSQTSPRAAGGRSR